MPDYNVPLGSVFPKPLETGFSIFSYLAKKRAALGTGNPCFLSAASRLAATSPQRSR